MKIVIPTAGAGTRLRPLTLNIPKILVQIAGKPIIKYLIDPLIPYLSELIFIVNNQGQLIKEYVSENYNVPSHFIYQEKRDGLGHAISLASQYCTDEPMLILNDDGILKFSPDKIFNSKHSLIGVKSVDNPQDFGVVEVSNNSQNVTRLVEKPSNPLSNLVITGLYYIKQPKLLFDCLNYLILNNMRGAKNEFQLTDALQLMLERGAKLETLNVDWIDCGKIDSLLDANRQILSQSLSHPETNIGANYIIIPPVWVGQRVKLVRSIIGPYVSIGSDVNIVDSIIQDSIVNRKAIIENLVLNRSLVGTSAVACGKKQSLNISDFSKVNYL